MSITLGEKLRQAREERGITLSEVAEQTRISSLYLESIEHDDYRNLPGGIFNKGFVKTFAKYVGINEQEALADYTRLIAGTDISEEATLKLYKPEVLTDDRSLSSMVPTIIGAVVVLAIMTTGILLLVRYLRQQADSTTANLAVTSNSNSVTNAQTSTVPANGFNMASLKVEFKALSQPIPLAAISDGAKTEDVVAAGSTATFEPKESLTLNYNKWNADKVQLTINGKAITLPAVPLNPKDKRIEFTISKDNITQILSSGVISTEVPRAKTDTNGNVAAPTTTGPSTLRPTPIAKPSPAANISANSATGTKPAANIKIQPTPKPVVIKIPPTNRPKPN